MALQGTIEDFGIADIFQLIGQQAKTGVLHLRGRDEEVHVLFLDGNVVGAENSQRRRQDLLGRMLVAAELIREEQLSLALEEQRRTLKRLGDLLISHGAITRDRLREMTQLQTTETIFRLFGWKSGTYEFEQGPVEWDRTAMVPIRSDSVLMEGLRMVDEWPSIRERLPSFNLTFVALQDLPEEPRDLAPGGAFATDDASAVGPNERRVFRLVAPGRTIRKLVDLSRLGEFETCKALLSLMEREYLRPLEAIPSPRSPDSARSRFARLARSFAVRFAVTALLAVIVLGVVRLRVAEAERTAGSPPAGELSPAALRLLAGPQLARIRGALEVYRAEHGDYPARLESLVGEGLLREDDLRRPHAGPYLYRREPDLSGFVLEPPTR